MARFQSVWALVSGTLAAAVVGDDVLKLQGSELQWTFRHSASSSGGAAADALPLGWALGQLVLKDGVPLEADWAGGLVTVEQEDGSEIFWLPALNATKRNESSVTFCGSGNVTGGGVLAFQLAITLASANGSGESSKVGVVTQDLTWRWEVPPSDNSTVWRVGLPLYGDQASRDWHAQLYPWAGNSTSIRQTPLTYNGVPAAVHYLADGTMVLHGLDPQQDYQNPTTWTGHTGYAFDQGKVAPRWLFSIGGPDDPRTASVQLFVVKEASMSRSITEIVSSWRLWNNYAVQPLNITSPSNAYDIFLSGRKKTSMWVPAKGYQVEKGTDFGSGQYICITSQSLSAYVNYRAWLRTGDMVWRNRSFEQIEFILKAQNTNLSSYHFGVIHSSYRLDRNEFTSNDRGHSPGLKVDLVAMMARYMLLTWQVVLDSEGSNMSHWRTAAVNAAKWVARQQRDDGGLPNRVDLSPLDNWDDVGVPSASVVSARSLGSLPMIFNATGDAELGAVIPGLEAFLRKCEDSLYFTGMHPDLHGGDFEPNSIWGGVEYWLQRYAHTGNSMALERALGDANLAFLMWCPGQLSWVENPTQGAFTEQQNYLQYSPYTYENKKVALLFKLAEITGDALWSQLAERIVQLNFFVMQLEGDCKGAFHEAISDPWLARRQGFNRLGSLYMDQLNIDLFLQLEEAGLLSPSKLPVLV